MKKFALLLVVLMFSLSLAACKKQEPAPVEQKAPETAAPEASPAAPQGAAPAETAPAH